MKVQVSEQGYEGGFYPEEYFQPIDWTGVHGPEAAQIRANVEKAVWDLTNNLILQWLECPPEEVLEACSESDFIEEGRYLSWVFGEVPWDTGRWPEDFKPNNPGYYQGPEQVLEISDRWSSYTGITVGYILGARVVSVGGSDPGSTYPQTYYWRKGTLKDQEVEIDDEGTLAWFLTPKEERL